MKKTITEKMRHFKMIDVKHENQTWDVVAGSAEIALRDTLEAEGIYMIELHLDSDPLIDGGNK